MSDGVDPAAEPRRRVLGNVRRALSRDAPLPRSVARGLEDRLARPAADVQPAVAGDPVERFVAKMEAVHAIVSPVPSLAGVPEVVERHLETHGLGDAIVAAPDPALADVPWSNRLSVERRAARGEDRVSVTGAFAGVAETGSLVLLSGPESPTTLNFLPEDHIVVLARERIVVRIDDVWTRLRAERETMPRTVNFITGPSKTADVEQTIQEGAHGPRRLHVLLVG